MRRNRFLFALMVLVQANCLAADEPQHTVRRPVRLKPVLPATDVPLAGPSQQGNAPSLAEPELLLKRPQRVGSVNAQAETGVSTMSSSQLSQSLARYAPQLDVRGIDEVQVSLEVREKSLDGGKLEFPKSGGDDLFASQQTIAMPSQFQPGLIYDHQLAPFCHRPTYFEDRALERDGRSWGLAQPAVSSAKFLINAAALPYKAVIEPPRECLIYQDGRPQLDSRPRVKAGLAEAGVILGLIFVLP